ncbi:MAG: cyclomaltodextrinase N-terminal domain-containing protein, partial [Lutibacter sp.]
MKKIILLFVIVFNLSCYAQKIDRIEPPNWWVGMNHNQLELLIYGKDIAQFTPSLDNKNIQISAIRKTENSNYMFLKLDLSKAVSGKFNINFSKKGKRNNFSVAYELKERNQDSKLRQGFNSSDVIYLITPDRFANADVSNDLVKTMNEKTVDRKNDYGRHGGDIKGITNHLDYIDEMG